MTESGRFPPKAYVVEVEVEFTIAQLSQASGCNDQFLMALVADGVLLPEGADPQRWRFRGECLRVTRTASRLARDFEMDTAGIALVLDLLQRIENLNVRLQRAGAG